MLHESGTIDLVAFWTIYACSKGKYLLILSQSFALMHWLPEAGCLAWCMCMKWWDSASLEDSDDWRFGVHLVPSLPHHKFPLSVNSKKTLTVIGECQAETEGAHVITPIRTNTAKMLPIYMSIQAVCRKHVRLNKGLASPVRCRVHWPTIGGSAVRKPRIFSSYTSCIVLL